MKEINIQWLDIDKVHPNSYNPNVMNAEKFAALVDFVKNHGAEELDPIWVRHDGADGFEVVDGEHRWKAAREAGWKRLRGFIIDLDVDKAQAFNVRKNRERGVLDAFKLGKIFKEEHDKGLTCEEIRKKYGYISKMSGGWVSELINATQMEEEIRNHLGIDTSTRVSIYKAIMTRRGLKREERGEPTTKTEEIVEEMVEEITPAIEKAFKDIKPHNKHDPERNKLVLNMLLKNLTQGLLFCPVCGEKMLECSSCHTSLQKMKEAQQL